MPVILRGLSIDPTLEADLAEGSLLRAVNAAVCRIEVGDWCRDYDGVAIIFLLDAIHAAAIAALVDRKSRGFFCLDDPTAGVISPGAPGRLEISLIDGGVFDVSGFELLAATTASLMQVGQFLTDQGHGPAAAQILVAETLRRSSGR
jgi:hypothetical protein